MHRYPFLGLLLLAPPRLSNRADVYPFLLRALNAARIYIYLVRALQPQTVPPPRPAAAAAAAIAAAIPKIDTREHTSRESCVKKVARDSELCEKKKKLADLVHIYMLYVCIYIYVCNSKIKGETFTFSFMSRARTFTVFVTR